MKLLIIGKIIYHKNTTIRDYQIVVLPSYNCEFWKFELSFRFFYVYKQ